MAKAPKRIKAAPDSELVHTIKEAISDGVAVIVDTGEETYPLHPGPPDGSAPRSKRYRDRLLSFAGIWSDLDGEELLTRLEQAHAEAIPSPPVEV